MSASFLPLTGLKAHSISIAVPVIHGSHGEKESMMNRRSRSTLEQVEHNLNCIRKSLTSGETRTNTRFVIHESRVFGIQKIEHKGRPPFTGEVHSAQAWNSHNRNRVDDRIDDFLFYNLRGSRRGIYTGCPEQRFEAGPEPARQGSWC